VLARALSSLDRKGSKLITGEGSAFSTDLEYVLVPWPIPPIAADYRLGVAACVALQAAPTKSLAAAIPFEEFTARQRSALQLVEGAAALGWARERWPGLAATLEELVRLEPQPWEGLTAEKLAERALRLAAGPGRRAFEVPTALGALPIRPAGSGLRPLARRAQSRLPWSLERTVERVRWTIAIPVGGRGGEQAPHNGVPPGSEEERPLPVPGHGVGITYPEWDVYTGAYRDDHVTVLERRPTLRGSRMMAPRRELEAWFRAPVHRRWERALTDGSDVDIDAVVAAYVDRVAGSTPSDRLYVDHIRADRDAAFVLLIDISGSLAQGDLLRYQLECADALADALAGTGERFAVHAFWSDTRHHVVVDVLCDFDARTDVRPSSARLRPQGYTRLGAPIRHATATLSKVVARSHAMLVLTDGLPCDEGYEGRYAVADVAKAVEEAERADVAVMVLGLGTVDDDPLAELLGDRLRRIPAIEDLAHAVGELHARLVYA
jgi:Mg-chelatase subunit ChlD